MAKAFTYSRLPEHQVAVYYNGSDKTGKLCFCRASNVCRNYGCHVYLVYTNEAKL